jgi:hypothetical protein
VENDLGLFIIDESTAEETEENQEEAELFLAFTGAMYTICAGTMPLLLIRAAYKHDPTAMYFMPGLLVGCIGILIVGVCEQRVRQLIASVDKEPECTKIVSASSAEPE